MPSFAEKHAEWTAAIRGDAQRPSNAIQWQVVELVHSAAWYRVILRARELSQSTQAKAPNLNPHLHRWIDTCFIHSFLVGVRRLAGGHLDSLAGPKSCNSLTALLRDLQKHRSLLTREHLLSLDNLPFDLVKADIELDKYMRAQVGSWHFIPPALDVRHGKERNAEIDRLCGVSASERSLLDTVHPDVLASLEARLSTLSDISLCTNKLIAHASTLESRQTDMRGDVEQVRIAIKDLWGALEHLARSVAAMDGWLIGRSAHAFLPTMHNYEWRGIDCPLVETHNVPALQEFWKALEQEAADWGNPSAAF